MKVNELIDLLRTFPQDLPVAYKCFSEQCLLEPNEIIVQDLCEPRADGWIQNNRPDMPMMKYLVFPGN